MYKLKIMHVGQSTGGVKTYIAQVIDHTSENWFEYSVAAPADASFQRFCADRRVTYYPADLERNLNPASNLKLLFRIIRFIRTERPDLLHVHSARAGFVGRLAGVVSGVPVVYTPHAFSYLPFSGVKRLAFMLLERLSRSWTILLLAISWSEANRAVYEIGYSPGAVRTIPNAISRSGDDCRNYTRCSTIGLIGRLTPQKNQLLFLRLARELHARYPHLRFRILGAGIHDELRPQIDRFISEHRLSDLISIEQWGDPGTTERFLSEVDIFLMPSLFEGLPFSLLEAMAVGLPCVVSKADGTSDVVHNNENGFSCMVFSEYIQRLEALIKDKDLRERIGRSATAYVLRHHDSNKGMRELARLYYSVADPAKKRK